MMLLLLMQFWIGRIGVVISALRDSLDYGVCLLRCIRTYCYLYCLLFILVKVYTLAIYIVVTSDYINVLETDLFSISDSIIQL